MTTYVVEISRLSYITQTVVADTLEAAQELALKETLEVYGNSADYTIETTTIKGLT